MEREKKMNKKFNIIYKKIFGDISCMTILNDSRKIINQLNDEEADYVYNTLVGNPQKNIKELITEKKELFIDSLKSRRVLNRIIKHTENNDQIIIETETGTIFYSKLKLAMFWLTHSNDDFYITFGFNWVPDSRLQDIARAKLNGSLALGIDFSNGTSHQVQKIETYIPKILNNEDLIKELSQYTSEMVQKGFRS